MKFKVGDIIKHRIFSTAPVRVDGVIRGHYYLSWGKNKEHRVASLVKNIDEDYRLISKLEKALQ